MADTSTTANIIGRLLFAALFLLNSIYASPSGHRRHRTWANAAPVAVATPIAPSHPSASSASSSSSAAIADDGEAARQGGDDGGGARGGELADPSITISSVDTLSASTHRPSSKHRDPYVSASPLSAAAVCRDGIALVSLHHDIDLVVDRFTGHGNDDNASNSIVSAIEDDQHRRQRRRGGPPFRDLPLSSRGPLRIESVRETAVVSTSSSRAAAATSSPPPVSLLTAGWRADGMALADAARELTSEEARLYCLPYLAMNHGGGTTTAAGGDDRDGVEGVGGYDDDDGTDRPLLEGERSNAEKAAATMTRDERSVPSHDDISASSTVERTPSSSSSSSRYGRRIADGLSYHLAKCAFSEGVRSLSCVGLLACGGGGGRGGGSLHLVDATGSHRVRAHAIGNGSSALHVRMTRIDFGTMDCREGLETLLNLIAEEGGVGGGGGGPSSSSVVNSSCRDGGEEMAAPLKGNVAKKENDFQSSRVVETKPLPDGGSSLMTKPAFVHGGNLGHDRQTQKEEERKQMTMAIPPTTTKPQNLNIPQNNAVELAVMKSDEGRMRRIRLSSLFREQ